MTKPATAAGVGLRGAGRPSPFRDGRHWTRRRSTAPSILAYGLLFHCSPDPEQSREALDEFVQLRSRC